MNVALIRLTIPREAVARTSSAYVGAPTMIRDGAGSAVPGMTTFKKRSLIPIVGLALAAAPIAAMTTGVAGAASTRTVTLKNIRYTPSAVTVSKGAKVRWVWRDGSIRHDVTFRNGGYKASRLQSGGSYTLTFKKKGTFRFFCSVHPGDMKGRVTVK
jgi:plastocyanin